MTSKEKVTPSAAVRTTSAAYRPRPDRLWFARTRRYTFFVLRELTSVFVAWTIAFTLMLVDAVLGGSLRDFAALASRPWMIVLNVVALAATAFHAITFLNLAPRATVVRLDGWRVPAWMIQGGNHSAWVLISALIAYFILRSP
ncbi:fumarate reductase subunit C [Nonomuraea diastatica]|nr:fumarate reductase subunit C [Nonomuraea diastatica]